MRSGGRRSPHPRTRGPLPTAQAQKAWRAPREALTRGQPLPGKSKQASWTARMSWAWEQRRGNRCYLQTAKDTCVAPQSCLHVSVESQVMTAASGCPQVTYQHQKCPKHGAGPLPKPSPGAPNQQPEGLTARLLLLRSVPFQHSCFLKCPPGPAVWGPSSVSIEVQVVPSLFKALTSPPSLQHTLMSSTISDHQLLLGPEQHSGTDSPASLSGSFLTRPH